MQNFSFASEGRALRLLCFTASVKRDPLKRGRDLDYAVVLQDRRVEQSWNRPLLFTEAIEQPQAEE